MKLARSRPAAQATCCRDGGCARGGVNGRRSAIVAAVWRRRYATRSRGGTSAAGRRAAVPAAALLVPTRWLVARGGVVAASWVARRAMTGRPRHDRWRCDAVAVTCDDVVVAAPASGGEKTSPTAWAGGTTSSSRRDGLASRRRRVPVFVQRKSVECCQHKTRGGSGKFK